MVGRRTALLDNPSLTTRNWYGKNPVRLVIDKDLTLPSHLSLFNEEAPTYIFTQRASPLRCRIRTPELRVRHPATNNGVSIRKKLQSLLVEGGSMLLQSFIDSDLWDEAYIEQSPSF